MAIDDLIGNEKLQYDIHRWTAKISALWSKQNLGKDFEKQIKTIEDQGEKQIKALKNQWQVKTIKEYIYDNEDTPLISKQKEIFTELADKTLDSITKLDEKVKSDNLIDRYKGKTVDEIFNEFDNALNLIDKIREGKLSLTDLKNNQAKINQI